MASPEFLFHFFLLSRASRFATNTLDLPSSYAIKYERISPHYFILCLLHVLRPFLLMKETSRNRNRRPPKRMKIKDG